jgi:hypothetical protein
VRYYQAQDTFVAVLGDGTEKLVVKGEPYAQSHELVKRDQEALKADRGRLPLFRLLDTGEPEMAAQPRILTRAAEPPAGEMLDEPPDAAAEADGGEGT